MLLRVRAPGGRPKQPIRPLCGAAARPARRGARACSASSLGALSTGFSLPTSLPARFWALFWSSASTSNSRYSVGCGAAGGARVSHARRRGGSGARCGAQGGRQRRAEAGKAADIRCRCATPGDGRAAPTRGRPAAGRVPWTGPAGRSQRRLAERGGQLRLRSGLRSEASCQQTQHGAAAARPALRAPSWRPGARRRGAHPAGSRPATPEPPARAKGCQPGSPDRRHAPHARCITPGSHRVGQPQRAARAGGRLGGALALRRGHHAHVALLHRHASAGGDGTASHRRQHFRRTVEGGGGWLERLGAGRKKKKDRP